MKVAIVGFEREGRSALEYWRKRGHEITICDQDADKEIPFEIDRQLGPEYLNRLDRFDLIVRTAGLAPEIILAENPGVESKITTVINEFLRVCPTRNTIGVTGTKGKGTTTTLIKEMLVAGGRQVFLGGNIGNSPLDFLDQVTPDAWVVLELSSFQLTDLKHSPSIAVCLMISPEHLDWHKTMDDYIDAKSNLFRHQTEKDIAVYYARNDISKTIASHSKGLKIPYFAHPGASVEAGAITIANEEVCAVNDLKLLGEHNWQNVCAALTVVWQITQDLKAIRSVLTTFSGLEHRLEFVRELRGVRYYNDTFATGPHATEAAIDAIPGTKVLILGGFDRNLPLDSLVHVIQERQSSIRGLLLIGQSAKRLSEALDKVGVTNYQLSTAESMLQIVAEAGNIAHEGDAVVLSPGFASFDMFKNFEQRGILYKRAVNNL